MHKATEGYFLYIAHGGNGEWVQCKAPDKSEFEAVLAARAASTPHILSIAWREGSYLSVRHNTDGSIQLICRARVGRVQVCDGPIAHESVVQTLADFAVQKKDWGAPLKWRAVDTGDQIWKVPFYRFFKPRFWSYYAVALSLFGAGALIPTNYRGVIFLGFALVVYSGGAVLSSTIGAKAWVQGLGLIERILGARLRLTPEPPSPIHSPPADYSLSFDDEQPTWKRPIAFGLLIANALAAILVFMGLFGLIVNGVAMLASWLGVPFATK